MVLVLIHWAIKELTPTESCNTITEKEMLAMVLEIKKVIYEHRGRSLNLILDQEALNKIEPRPEFGNI